MGCDSDVPFVAGVILGQAFKDLPKHMNKLGENVLVVGRDLVDRFWVMKAEVDRRVAEINRQKGESTTTKATTARTTNKKSNEWFWKYIWTKNNYLFVVAETTTQRATAKPTTTGK